MAIRNKKRVGEILKQWGRLSSIQLDEALKVAQGARRKIGDVLVELGYVSETDVAQALAVQYELEFIDLETPDAISKDSLKLMPLDLIQKYLVLPLAREGNRMKVLIHDPMDLETLDNLRFRLGCEVDIALGSRKQIKEFVDRMMGQTKDDIQRTVHEMTMDARKDSVDASGLSLDIRGVSVDVEAKAAADGSDEANAAPVVKLVNSIIYEGVVGRASDIHIEPMGDRVRLRYRIDGVCVERDTIPKRVQSAIIARLKIMAGVKIEERRIPQDGRIKMKIDDKMVDFRFSCCPAYHGESVVMRVLRPDSARLSLDKLGLQPDTRDLFNKVIKRPNGIFFVTGPTGSGKTTTLYSALNELNRPDKKIITAEDPVEYNFKGINQCQVNEAIGLKFSLVLRAMLRQAPQIVLVGEVRDKEVADVAIQAALTGHLVFSTLHTNDAPSAITRLIDMGVKPFLVASAIQAVLAQRLVRTLCDECKQPDTAPDKKFMKLCGLKMEDFAGGKTLYKAVGCPKCGGNGYRGRQGIHEMMIMNSEIRSLAFKRAPINQLRAAAAASGMRNLLGSGKLLIMAGRSTPDEISRIAQVEGTVDLEDDSNNAA